MIFDLVLRTGVVLGMIMVTKRLGIWDSSDLTIDFYNSSKDRLMPYGARAVENLHIHVPDLPPDREKSFLGIYYWNLAVTNLSNFLRICPQYIHKVLEVVPGYLSDYTRRARCLYEDYMRKRAEEKEKEKQKLHIDEGPLVMPMNPDSKSEGTCKIPPGLIPKDPPRNPSDDPSLKYPAKPKCECSKCKRREEEGWMDHKPKCENRMKPKDEYDTTCNCTKCKKEGKPQCKPRKLPENQPNDEPGKCKCPKKTSATIEDNLRTAGILNNEPIKSFWHDPQRSK